MEERVNDQEFQNFWVDPNFDQFINLVRGDHHQIFENPAVLDFDLSTLQSSPCFIDENQFISTSVHDLFDKLPDSESNVAESFHIFDCESVQAGEEEEDYNDCDDSTATTTNTDGSRNTKTDRSRTLVSERKRRGRMKDKLYALRSLVPNITKMDKASIIGDAVSYVQELQSQAKKLKSDIVGLEASLNSTTGRHQELAQNAQKTQPFCSMNPPPVSKKIIQMDVIQVEDKEFYVRLVCNKGVGVTPCLYKSLESLTSFQVQHSNLSSPSPDRYLLTYTLDGKCFEQSLNLPNVKLWITGSLINQGFEFIKPFN